MRSTRRIASLQFHDFGMQLLAFGGRNSVESDPVFVPRTVGGRSPPCDVATQTQWGAAAAAQLEANDALAVEQDQRSNAASRLRYIDERSENLGGLPSGLE